MTVTIRTGSDPEVNFQPDCQGNWAYDTVPACSNTDENLSVASELYWRRRRERGGGKGHKLATSHIVIKMESHT